MDVHQLSIAFVAEQDRLLARVNTREGQELQFWLTRRIALGLAPLMDRLLIEQVARQGGPATSHLASLDALSKKAMADFQRSDSLRGADFATPYQPSGDSKPLFDTPLLVTDLNVTPKGKSAVHMQFVEKLPGCDGQRSFETALQDQMVYAFVHLLEVAIASAQWCEPAASAAASPAGAHDGEKPQYLN